MDLVVEKVEVTYQLKNPKQRKIFWHYSLIDALHTNKEL